MAPLQRHDSFRRILTGDGGGGGGALFCIRLLFTALYGISAVLSVVYGICTFQCGMFNVLGPEGPLRGIPLAIATDWSR
jgi:hypothetical protein